METSPTPLERIGGWINDHRVLSMTCAVTLLALCALKPLLASPPQQAQAFQVTTYNTLAPTYAGINGGAWYSHIDPSLMTWELRQEALIQHIQSIGSDIYCLQEVEPEFFARLQIELKGYTGVFANEGAKPGEALFFRAPFTLSESTKAFASDGRLGQVVELRFGDQRIALLNTHLAWDEKGVKAYQEVQELFEKALKPRRVDHLIICGDFNVTRDTGAIRYLEDLGFRRAYQGVEPSVTCSVQSAAHEVDFILATHLKPLKVHPVRQVSGLGVLPCEGEPSDHLAKTVVYSL